MASLLIMDPTAGDCCEPRDGVQAGTMYPSVLSISPMQYSAMTMGQLGRLVSHSLVWELEKLPLLNSRTEQSITIHAGIGHPMVRIRVTVGALAVAMEEPHGWMYR